MMVIESWTGKRATALQRAMRLTNEAFANRLGVAVRTVANWHARPTIVPSADLQQVLDTMHKQASKEAQTRFAHLAAPDDVGYANDQPDPLRSLTTETRDAMDWLDDRANLTDGESERAVGAAFRRMNPRVMRSLVRRRSKIGRSQLAAAIGVLYDMPTPNLALYNASVDNEPLQTTMLVKPSWLCSGIPLERRQDQFEVIEAAAGKPAFDAVMHAAAAERIAEIVASGTRFFDAPLYSLRDVAISPRAISGKFAMSSFREYALTTDLITTELVDALADRSDPAWEALPLRRRYLPNIETATDLGNRAPGGGILALFAAARPADGSGQPADYLLLVQERSRQVVNANGQLAVIPKAFHQPMANFAGDAHLSATLIRELEEELFGRQELEFGAQGVADPIHLTRLSEPMRWLMNRRNAATWQMDCTGFGLNLLTGNYEFSVLTVVHDEQWWATFGGQVVANWEASHVQQYSSADPEALRRLVRDDRWSNEGLFSLLRGLQRLAELSPDRTNIPEIIEEL
jgi:hypothetical protein